MVAMQQKLMRIARTAGIANVGTTRVEAAKALKNEGDYSAAHKKLEEGAAEEELSASLAIECEPSRSCDAHC